ncbi:MAG: hypothetical protein WC860_02265 [Candidatus Margulisiibacteriota bacterium]|jgi:hypothetical protein
MNYFTITSIYINKDKIFIPNLIEKNLYSFLNNLDDQKEFLHFIKNQKKIKLIQYIHPAKSPHTSYLTKILKQLTLIQKKQWLKKWLLKTRKIIGNKNKLHTYFYQLFQNPPTKNHKTDTLLKLANFFEIKGFSVIQIIIKQGSKKYFIRNNGSYLAKNTIIFITILLFFITYFSLKTYHVNIIKNYQVLLTRYEKLSVLSMPPNYNLNKKFLFFMKEINALPIAIQNLKIKNDLIFLKGFVESKNSFLVENKLIIFKKSYPDISLSLKPINNNLTMFLITNI